MLPVPIAPIHAPALASVQDTVLAMAVSSSIRRGVNSALRWPDFSDVSGILVEAYGEQQWSLLWSRAGQPTETALRLLAALQDVGTRGLDPRDYDVARLRSLADSGLVTAAQQVSFDVTMSVAAIRVLHSLRFGRVDPNTAHAHLRLPRDVVDMCAEFQSMVTAPAPDAVLDAAEPPYVHYALLKQALGVYRARAATDTAARKQVNRIQLSLERWRWVPQQFTTAPIIVNIPAFRLYALSPDSDREADMLRMDVVVGNAYKHRTPVFSDLLEYIMFAPYWDVPPSIARAELIPLARRKPNYLRVNQYEVVTATGRVLAPTAGALRVVSAGSARIRQRPGSGNALGTVKFVFPNRFNVYLHDTPVKSAFLRSRRDMSHGCIRISKPFALAQLLLRTVPGWDSTAIATAMGRKAPLRVDLPQPVPVHIIYATAMAREDGTVLFYDDIYGLDAELARLLRRGYPYRRARGSVMQSRQTRLRDSASASESECTVGTPAQ
jgi:murein L,D-transpeptidase YcbB/YkuD